MTDETVAVKEVAADSERSPPPVHSVIDGFIYTQYRDERDLGVVMDLVDNELSEPYSIFTYRYFLNNWPTLCFLVHDGEHCFGTVVCKLDQHKSRLRGYLAMLVVEKQCRSRGVGSYLVKLAIEEMIKNGADEVTLEAEVTNKGALKLYENLGFIRDKRLHKYYLSGTDAYRLKLLLPSKPVEHHSIHSIPEVEECGVELTEQTRVAAEEGAPSTSRE
ncbi:hypothetical protein BSKO_03809 [Bryopsis sp. KO-2023]|nr:hypothetical protein BSKO_03809 [Bryopsis sp. KO-2023]